MEDRVAEIARTALPLLRTLRSSERNAAGRSRLFWLAPFIGMLALLTASWAVATKYVYDDNGRLVVTVNEQSGESARYVYDKVGNLLKIDRLAAGQVAIFSFTPARGASGITVRIEGQGFSEIPTDNLVRFNGVAAPVIVAKLTELDVLVPAGATTGPLTVTVGSQTVSGPADFVVDESAMPPVITGVTPMIGNASTVVTVTGQRLYPAPDMSRVLIGTRVAVHSDASNTQVIFAVPSRAGSGKISISTPYGSAQTESDFVVLPTGTNPADVINVGRIALDAGERTVATNTAGQSVALLLPTMGAEMTSLQFSGLGSTKLTYSVYAPDNRLLITGEASGEVPSLHLPPLSAGVNLLLLKPGAPASWNLAWEKNPVLGPQAEPVAMATIVANQSKRLTMKLDVGGHIGIGLHELLTPNSVGAVQARLYRPDGSQLSYENCDAQTSSCDLNLTVGMPGQYSLIVQPSSIGDRTMSFKASLSEDRALSLAPAVPTTLILDRFGQNGRLSFSAQAGQTFAFRVEGQSTTPADRDVYYTVYKPDGSVLQQAQSKSDLTLNLEALVAGSYLLYVDPKNGETSTAQITLIPGETGAIGAGQDPLSFSTAAAGQNIYFSFSAEQGANLGLGLSELATPGGTGPATVYVYRPDGSQLSYEYCYAEYKGCDLNLANLPAGAYRAMVTPPATGARTMSFKTSLSTDLILPLSLDAELQAITVPRPGQNARLTFQAQAGQTRAFNVSAQSTQPENGKVYYTVYKPDGSVLHQADTRDDLTLNLPGLPASGTYTIFMDPGQGEAASMQAKLVSGQVGGPDPGGSLGSFATQTPGQNVYFTFDAAKDANLGLGISDLLTPGTVASVLVYVYKPGGSELASVNCSTSENGCDLDLAIPETGTYNVTVMPPSNGNRTMSFKATLSEDKVSPLTLNAPLNYELPRPGENGRLTFSAEAGQTFALSLTGAKTSPAGRKVNYRLYKPDGASLYNTIISGDLTINLSKLPVSGQYTLFIDPDHGETYIAQATLLPGEVGVVDGGTPPRSFATKAPGQNVYFEFTAEQGANLGLGISDLLTVGTIASAQVIVYRPDGTQLTSGACYATDGGCDLDLSNLTAGTYSVLVAPPAAASTMSFNATVSADAVITLATDMPVNMALNRRGQNARLRFSANAGQTFAFGVSGQNTVPGGRSVSYTVHKPDGSLLQQASTSSAVAMNLFELPASGEYFVFVDPRAGETVSAQVILGSGESQSIAVGGDPTSFLTRINGQYAYFSFNATQGANLGLGISDLATPGTIAGASVYVYRPDGTQLTSRSCYATDGGCDLDLAGLAAGRYTAIVYPPSNGNGVMTFNLTVSPDVVNSLTPNTPLDLSLPRRGQNARLKFAANLGQTFVFNVTNQISMPVGRKVYYSVNKPDGGLLQQGYAVSGLTMNLPDLPVSGDYTLFVDPESGESASSQVKLSVGQSADLQFGGAPHSFTAEAPGQNVYFKFDAQQGANVGIGIADLTIAGSNGAGATVYVYRADGSQVTSRGCSPSDNGCDVDLWNLAAGRYSVVVIPNSGAGVLNFSVSASLDAVHVLTPDVAKALTLSRRGENARLKFAANAGQSFAFGIASQTTMPSGRKVYYTVYRPDGTVLQQAYATGPATMNLYELPVSGEYMLFVDPESGETANMQVTLLTGQTAELQPGSAERSFSTQSPGQYGYIRFDAQQGANVGIGIGSLIISQGSATVYVDRANGSRVTSRGCSTDDNGCDLDLWNLEAGRYTVTVIPNVNTATMSFNAAVSLDAAHVLTPGSSLNLALARIGENARLRFSASAGESFAFSVSGQNTVPTGRRVYYTVYKPDGSVLQQSYTTTTLTMNIANVPVSGEYLLFVDPNSGEAVSAVVGLLAGQSSTLMADGTSANLSTQLSGQNAYLDFTAAQGANFRLAISALTTPNTVAAAMVYIYRSDGTQVTSLACYASDGGCGVDLRNLSAGRHTVSIFAPANGSGTMSFSAALRTLPN